MNDSTNEYKTLLHNFKSILDVLLSPRLRVAISHHDPIRLYLAIQKIITHQLKYSDTWPFTDTVTAQPKDVQLRRDKRLLWIVDSIERNTLGESVRLLVGDAEFLANIYHEQAFLRQDKYAEAFLICISALERQQPNLLTQIDQCLLTILSSDVHRHKVHRRSNSHPHFTLDVPAATKVPIKRSISDGRSAKQIINLNLRPWFSLPNLATSTERPRSRSKTICSTDDRWTPVRVTVQPETPKVPSFAYTPVPSSTNLLATPSSFVRPESTPNYDEIEIHFDRSQTPKREKKPLMKRRSSKKLINFIIGFDPEDFTSGDEARNYSTSPVAAGFIPEILVKEGEKLPKSPRANFLDDLAGAGSGCSTRTIPKPFSGQSLPDFLKRIQTSANKNADLDRENAHMIVSEAIIAAIEQLKCNQLENARDELRFRRSEPSASSSFAVKSSVESCGELASISSSYGSPGCYVSESDTEIPELVPLPSQQQVIEADLAAIEWEEADDSAALSAEGVALSLLSKFNAKQLPCASEIMMWMVSEKDAPQQILPMPDYLIANPDNPEYNGANTIIRGTKEWAPPRQQIIFTRHPPLE
jgi:run domain Beclin-1 interacting and cysteine-rich containing protein